MGEVLLQIVWVAAHHGLRHRNAANDRMYRRGSASWELLHAEQNALWPLVHDITTALGNPPAPGGSR